MMTRRYAEDTSVSPSKSRAEIERTLDRYGADQFIYGWESSKAVVGFRMNGRHIKFVVPMPDRQEFNRSKTGRARSDGAIDAAYQQAIRQRWRALALAIKSKLEVVESGISEFDDEFMAHIVLPTGQTVGQWMRPQIEVAYTEGKMPPLLGYSGSQ